VILYVQQREKAKNTKGSSGVPTENVIDSKKKKEDKKFDFNFVEGSPKLEPKSKPPSNTSQISQSTKITNELSGKNQSPKTNVPMFGQPLDEVIKREGSVSGVPLIIEKGADCIEQNGTFQSMNSFSFTTHTHSLVFFKKVLIN
jgi:hypothetical protein